MIHVKYKKIQLLSVNTVKHSYDYSYSLPIYHTCTEVKYFYSFNINHTHTHTQNMFFSCHTLNNFSLSSFAPKVISIN